MSDFASVKQGSREWELARVGRITASRLADLMATTKSGYSASRKNYLAELLIERMTGEPTEHFVSKEMQWGTEHEPEARSLYELTHGYDVQEVGFVVHRDMDYFGASPDGLIEGDGTIEIKCPNTATHIDTLRTQNIAYRYYKQIQGVLECTNRRWCDYVSYDPRMKDSRLQMVVIRVYRNEDEIAEIVSEVQKAHNELLEMEQEMQELAEKAS